MAASIPSRRLKSRSDVQGVPLPLAPPIAPMLARLARELPEGDWIYEPKYRVDGVRFRHPARFVRWRPDRDPRSCTLDQLRGFG